MSLIKNEQPKEKQEAAYMTRDALKRDAYKISKKSRQQKETETAVQQEPSLQELQEEMLNLSYMKKATADEANQDKQVSILLSTVLEIGRIQEDFMKSMLEKFDEMNENQLKLLNVENEYRKDVVKNLADTYASMFSEVKNSQIKANNDMQKAFRGLFSNLIKNLNSAKKNLKNTADHTRSTADRIMKLEKFKYYFIMSTPVVMIADIIIHFLK